MHGWIGDAMRMVEISEVKIHALEIEIDRLPNPPIARATFNFVGTVKARNGEFGPIMRPGKAIVHMHREPAGWIIYEHKLLEDPR